MAMRARAGGICGSPVSSEDEATDVFAYDDGERAPPKKRRRARPRAPPAKRVRSKKELVREAPPRFVAYLAEQLSPASQAQFCEEFGFGQGYMLRLPTAWTEVRERREFGEWVTQLGFLASTVHRHLYRISSLNVEIVLAELRSRVRPENTSIVADSDVSMNCEGDTEPAVLAVTPAADDARSLQSKRDDAASLKSFKEHFRRLDSERLEMLSISEHDRLLSTIRHEQIADAMEEVLARPSIRKERDRARRMSKLGRIAERRLSAIPMRPSVLPSTILEDPEWEDEEIDGFDAEAEPFDAIPEEDEEDEEDLVEGDVGVEQVVAPASDGAVSATETELTEQPEDFVTPRKSLSRVQTRRSSIGAKGTPTHDSVVATPMRTRRSSVGIVDSTPEKLTPSKSSLTPLSTPGPRSAEKPAQPRQQMPISTPQKTPVRTPGKTPRRTPLRTPRRSSLSGVRRSSITKAALLEIKRWKLLGRSILGAVFNSGFLDLTDLKAGFNVSRIWREVSLPAYAWSVADYSKQLSALAPMAKIYANCPRGHYLSDGAYKEVFKVYSTRHKRLEAVSVMDIRAIESTGNQHIVRQEVAHSLLLSELVRSRFSPHFVEIYDVFLARERPETIKWGSASCRKPVDLLTGSRTLIDPAVLPAENLKHDRLFQYIHMEFCDGGDIEDFIGLQENKLLPVTSVVIPFFFQMVFGIYSARERFHMRHCDIKLLNFFLKDISRKGLKCAEHEPMSLQYVIGEDVFNVQLPATFSYWVKLADYGTADSTVENLGKPVTLDQFTTLENTPVEFLLDGDQAQQSFAADTFSLGLCLLHLFTGCAPYEEILEDVKCPAPLLQDLRRLWMSGKKNSPFSVLRRVCQDDQDDVLIHTLYRYLVMFGLPDSNPSASRQFDRVWVVLVKHLRPEGNSDSQPSRQSSRRAVVASKKSQTKSAKDQFHDDQAQFSIVAGCRPVIQRARERMTRIPGATELLLSLVAFDPSVRPTMKQTLFHDIFKSLRSMNCSRPAHYSIDCYAAERISVDRLPDV